MSSSTPYSIKDSIVCTLLISERSCVTVGLPRGQGIVVGWWRCGVVAGMKLSRLTLGGVLFIFFFLGLAVFCFFVFARARNAIAVPGANTPSAWTDRIRAVLPEYEWPNRIVVLPALPRFGNGKIDRARLIADADAEAGRSVARKGRV